MTSTAYSTKYFPQFAAKLSLVAGLLLCSATPVSAQYTVTNLVSNQNAIGSNPADPDLINAWGIISLAGSPFWVSDNGTGKSTLYTSAGKKQGLVVTIPPASGTGPGSPTGVIGNTTTGFVVSATVGGVPKSGASIFIFATLDGTISGWNPGVLPTEAVIAVNRSNVGASYTGLTSFTNTAGTSFLYAANSVQGGGIDIFDSGFHFLQTVTDPAIPQNFAPYGTRVINNQLWVTFTSTKKAQSGFVDVFQIDSTNGTLTKLFEANGPLHSPWGLALAPPNFGPFSNAVLIGNNIENGEINAFDASNGMFLGHLADGTGRPITINQLWGLDFGKGAANNGATNQLFFTAGPDNYANGLFGVITVSQ